MKNHRLDLRHAYACLEDQLADNGCLLHPGCNGSSCNSVDSDSNIHFGIAGAPCDPYSTQRSKRYHDGSVANHPDFHVLNDSMISFWKKYEPKTGIVEQVVGFSKATSVNDPVTPLQRQGLQKTSKSRMNI